MINKELLFRENQSVMLTLLHKDLYEILEDKSQIVFHDYNCYKLFFIYLHDYISAQFEHPEKKDAKLSLFDLTMEVCDLYKENEYFQSVITKGELLKSFLSKERTYPKVYIFTHSINLKTNLLELINFAGNEAKHSYFRLTRLRDKMKKLFERNDIIIKEDREYYEHLEYFMEYVVEDKLNYHQTKIIELLGNYFLAINKMLNAECSDGRLIGNKKIEDFYWEIMGLHRPKNSRLIELIPKTHPALQKRI